MCPPPCNRLKLMRSRVLELKLAWAHELNPLHGGKHWFPRTKRISSPQQYRSCASLPLISFAEDAINCYYGGVYLLRRNI